MIVASPFGLEYSARLDIDMSADGLLIVKGCLIFYDNVSVIFLRSYSGSVVTNPIVTDCVIGQPRLYDWYKIRNNPPGTPRPPPLPRPTIWYNFL